MEAHLPGGWETTRLWSELSNREEPAAAPLKLILSTLLPEVESVLNKGDSPADFTLHDAEHSRRVAELMARIAGEDLLRAMGPQDLALLLLSAYLHDIGMTPPLAKTRDHYDYLVTGDANELSPEECEEFQAWLDDEWDGLIPPLAGDDPSASDLHLAQQITASYVRHKHNEWGAAWMRENLEPYAKEEYPGWVEDVVTLCKSHHFSPDQLKSTNFDPRRVGNPPTVLHLRFCACLLRVADVLDFDPERTPPVLFAHRSVGDESVIFWHKDHEVSFALEDSTLSLHASPRDALTHHAIEQTVSAVDHELLVSRRLADETQFHRMAGQDADLPHRWRLETSVRARITPRDDAYEYIDGTFRPDPSRLLELVGGVELYGSPLAGVRELLQNAFDAVRDQIARQRLRQEDPANSEVGDHIARTHSVSLTLEERDGELRLICRDTGSGMSRDIIRSRFLVGGKRASHEMRALERTCEEYGFNTGKTARFGIGVLSYFLVASKMEIRTRRSIEASDPDGTGWSFTSTGLDDFGELRASPGAQVGTEVELSIKTDLVGGDASGFAKELRTYIDDTLRRVPCRFTFNAPGLDIPPLTANLGWADHQQAVQEMLVELVTVLPEYTTRTPEELISVEAREDRKQSLRAQQQLREEMLEALSTEVHEGELPDRLGYYRVFFNRFDIEGHSSAAFVNLEETENGSLKVGILRGSEDCLCPRGTILMSWNGMQLDSAEDGNLGLTYRSLPGMVVEIDWCSDAAGRLAVDRNSFKPSATAKEAVEEVHEVTRAIRTGFVEKTRDTPLCLLNARVLGVPAIPGTAPQWLGDLSAGRPRTRSLAPVQGPLIDRPQGGVLDCSDLFWRDEPVTVAHQMSVGAEGFHQNTRSWHGWEIPPSHIAVVKQGGRLRLVPVWSTPEIAVSGDFPLAFTAEFPPGLHCLVGLKMSGTAGEPGSAIWNGEHPLVKACDLPAWKWAAETFSESLDPLPHREDLEESAARTAAWMLLCLMSSEGEVWNGLRDRAEGFLADAWSRVDGLAEADEVLFWLESYERRLKVLSPEQWQMVQGSKRDDPQFVDRFELPDSSWWLSYADGETELRRRIFE